ncbi:hypothetical protein PODOV084v1_p0003 [Vibrio phage 340E47.2]|nr:hypothetical protein PODOV084v1_p0003 [Vibrio phage 340E47.2]QZI91961.1 putative tail accessory protein [Vibrio phage 5P1a]
MRITKGKIIDGAYALLRISGQTVDPTPDEVALALDVADGFAGQLKGDGLDVQWNMPAEYGDSTPDDNSGLIIEYVEPFKKLLALELLNYFGKPIPPIVAETARQGHNVLCKLLVCIPVAQNPATLPIGSGNEFDYRDNKFFQEPPPNEDALYVFLGDILNYEYDFNQWLVDEELLTVEYDADPRSASVGTTSVENGIATAEVTFQELGGFTLCITATKTGSTDRFTVRQNFVITECRDRGVGFIRGV